jgi:hypothetical protein
MQIILLLFYDTLLRKIIFKMNNSMYTGGGGKGGCISCRQQSLLHVMSYFVVPRWIYYIYIISTQHPHYRAYVIFTVVGDCFVLLYLQRF